MMVAASETWLAEVFQGLGQRRLQGKHKSHVDAGAQTQGAG